MSGREKMSDAIEPKLPSAQSESEVIDRLKNKPDSIKITAVKDDKYGDPQHWVVIVYRFVGPLKKFGKFISDIVDDVTQADGLVTQIQLGTGLCSDGTTRDPKKDWSALHVEVSIRTREHVKAEQEFWAAGVRSIFERHKT